MTEGRQPLATVPRKIASPAIRTVALEKCHWRSVTTRVSADNARRANASGRRPTGRHPTARPPEWHRVERHTLDDRCRAVDQGAGSGDEACWRLREPLVAASSTVSAPTIPAPGITTAVGACVTATSPVVYPPGEARAAAVPSQAAVVPPRRRSTVVDDHRQKKNPRHHDKREQHFGPPRPFSQVDVSGLFLMERRAGREWANLSDVLTEPLFAPTSGPLDIV